MTEDEEKLEVDAALRERARAAVSNMQQSSIEHGLDALTDAEIEAEITRSRAERNANFGSEANV